MNNYVHPPPSAVVIPIERAENWGTILKWKLPNIFEPVEPNLLEMRRIYA